MKLLEEWNTWQDICILGVQFISYLSLDPEEDLNLDAADDSGAQDNCKKTFAIILIKSKWIMKRIQRRMLMILMT